LAAVRHKAHDAIERFQACTGEIMQSQAAFSFLHTVSALGVAVVWIAAFSLLREPMRHKLSAIMIAGAGAAYLSGGLGAWEFVACAAFTAVAYRGLDDYRFIGLGWVMHTCWDLVHHFHGHPIIPFAPDSSAGCAICDLLLAAWYFLGARSIFGLAGTPHKKPAEV
jgi:hypothetical protein